MALITKVLDFALEQHGHKFADHAKLVREAHFDIHGATRLLPDGGAAARTAEKITGDATPFTAHMERWKPHAGLKPRPLDQAISSIKQFHEAVGKPLQRVENKDVQAWIDGLINPDGEDGLSSKTINRKLGEIRNYWRWLQSHQIVREDHNPFAGRRVRDPASRRKSKEEQRQRFRPEDIVLCWMTAEQSGDAALAAAIKIAAYSGARIEGVAQLRVIDIRTDPETRIRFMKMNDKTASGDRFVPVHKALTGLLMTLIKQAGTDGFLIESAAANKYGERNDPRKALRSSEE